MSRPLLPSLILLSLVVACGDAEPQEAASTEDPRLAKCPKIHLDRMAGQWIHVNGKAADPGHRFELIAGASTGSEVGTYEMWYVGGGFTKLEMDGVRRSTDFQFTERKQGKRGELYDKAEGTLVRLYVEPKLDKCALRISEVELVNKDGAETERPKVGFTEYLPMPEGQTLTFRPCDDPLYLGKAATSWSVASKQLATLGGPDPAYQLGDAIPVGAWVADPAGEPAGCTYDMDLYFDDQTVKEGGKALPAGQVTDGKRSWLVPGWKAPYSGNHHFEIYRYHTCSGARELMGVSCLESVLM